MDWADFCTAITFLIQKYSYASVYRQTPNLAEGAEQLILPCTLSRCVWPTLWDCPASHRLKVCNLLSTTHLSKSTVPRDKVYALLGLANEFNILVDYDVALRDLYIDVTRYLLSTNDTN
jgi:hypothetical protein